ncbi:MAG TPA: NrfD/PsrC family molybdoenzyme membrane anchor subunit [Thermoanaerobaculia bacterium]|nr:NrfD/PsrC family molybdoenzyme membrane anchor subunit [Thermoanaerobaculia bacterium]
MKATEARLDEIRRTAAALPASAPKDSYYDLPLLKAPVWTWEIPTYFFIGGAAGAAAVIGAAARMTGANEKLVRDARWIAAIGANLSTPLLIADLGRPERFLYMLRIFKPQSPMSVGAWIVAAFGGASTAALFVPTKTLKDLAAFASAATGLGMATYTGVLLGATAIPVWAEHVATLPIHFGASALGSAASLLQLRGHDTRAIRSLALGAAVVETATSIAMERRDHAADDATKRTTRLGGILAGPVPLALRLLGGRSKTMRRMAAVSALAGSLITRFEWVAAGKESARNAAAALAPRRDSK